MELDLIEMVGKENVKARGEEKERQYQLQAPLIAFPCEERHVVQMMGWASANQVRIAPQGGGTKDAYGHHGDGTDVILSVKKMAGILHHSVGDLTVTVLPGTTLYELQQALGKEGQFLPLDPAWEKQSTIGGIVAANASGPRRAMYGSARDYLIASRVCYPDGTLIRTGAKVVKNVAGYDMNKLLIGSMGTLGVFTELTFKIRPVPAYAGGLVIGPADPLQLRKLQEILLDSQLEPSAVEWINERLGAGLFGTAFKGPVLFVSFADVWRSVMFQLNWLKSACDSQAIPIQLQILGHEELEAVFSRMRERTPSSTALLDEELVISVKLLSMIADVPDIYAAVQQAADERDLALDFHGGLYTGISRATIRADWEQQQKVCDWLSAAQAILSQLHGRSVIEVAPCQIKTTLSMWGTEAEDWGLMKGIKSKIDPKRILNPGRFVGGI